jgi:hypothetical protein
MRTCRPGALLRSRTGALLCGVIVIGVTYSGSAAASQGHPSPADSTNCSSTTPVSGGQAPVSGSIADPSAPPQCFTFDDVSGDTVFVNAVATSTNPTPGVEVVDPNGTPLSAEQDSGVIYPTDASGTYTIEVTDTSAGPFNLDFQRMDDPVGCTSVAFGEPSFTTSITSPGEALCFQISVTSTEWISIRVRKPAPIELAVFGADGSLGGYINPQNPAAPFGAGFLDGSDFGTQPLLAFVGGQSPLTTGPLLTTIGDIGVHPLAGPPGTGVHAFGSGFTPGERFKVTYATGIPNPAHALVCQGIVPRSGQPRCSGPIPTGVDAGEPGPHVITMTGQTSKHSGEESFDLS